MLVGEVAREGLSIETPRIGRADQNRIIAILEHIGWMRAAKKDERGYQPWSPPSALTTDDN